MIFGRDEYPTVQGQRRRYADVVVLEHHPLSVRFHFHQEKIVRRSHVQFLSSDILDSLGGRVDGKPQGTVRVVGAVYSEDD